MAYLNLGNAENYVMELTSGNVSDVVEYLRRKSLTITPRGTRYGISEEDAGNIAFSLLNTLHDEGRIIFYHRICDHKPPVFVTMG